MVQRCADVQCIGRYICTKVYKRIYQEGWIVTKWKRQVRQGDGFANKASRTDRVCLYHTYIYIFIITLYTIHAHCGLWVTTRNKFPASSLHILGNWVVSCVHILCIYLYTAALILYSPFCSSAVLYTSLVLWAKRRRGRISSDCGLSYKFDLVGSVTGRAGILQIGVVILHTVISMYTFIISSTNHLYYFIFYTASLVIANRLPYY